jgi:hypothetical protein
VLAGTEVVMCFFFAKKLRNERWEVVFKCNGTILLKKGAT